jgi:hypothetical protein
VGLRRWRFQDILLRPAEGEVVPGTTVTLSIAALVGGLDTLADRAAGADVQQAGPRRHHGVGMEAGMQEQMDLLEELARSLR